MKRLSSISALCFVLWLPHRAPAEDSRAVQDIKVDVGGYSLQFHVIPGMSPTIIFEAGGGDDSSTWRDTVPVLKRQIGARMITYDRAGFGQSDDNPGPYSVTQDVESLERGLRQLQVHGDLILVAHSYGGFLATLFASRNSPVVKGVVLIDANLALFFADDVVDWFVNRPLERAALERAKKENPRFGAGVQKLWDAFPETVRTIRGAALPANLRLTDIVAEKPPVPPPYDAAWLRAHQDFDKAAPNRRGVFAAGSGHYVMRDKPELVTNEIAAMFRATQ